MAEVAPALASASLQDLIDASRRDLAARARRRRRRATAPSAHPQAAAVTTPQTGRRATAPAATSVVAPPPSLPQTPQSAVSTVWQRLQATLAATPMTSSKAAEGGDELAAAALAAAAAAVSPEAPGPGQLARLVTATPSFREFATPTPSKRRRLERDESVPRELADLGAASLVASPQPTTEH